MLQTTVSSSKNRRVRDWHTLEKKLLIQKLEEVFSYKDKLEEALRKSLKTICDLRNDNQALRVELDKIEEAHRELKQKNNAIRMTWLTLAESAKEERMVIFDKNQEIARLNDNIKTFVIKAEDPNKLSKVKTKPSDEKCDDGEWSEVSADESEDEISQCSLK